MHILQGQVKYVVDASEVEQLMSDVAAIKDLLEKPKERYATIKEFMIWYEKQYGTTISYNTVLNRLQAGKQSGKKIGGNWMCRIE